MSSSAKQINQQFLGVKIYTLKVEVMVTQLTLILTLSLGIGFGIGFKFCRMLTILLYQPYEIVGFGMQNSTCL